MLTSKQKVFKKIYDRYLNSISQAIKKNTQQKQVESIKQADENKRLHLLALNSIM
jgi:hypothetical protein